jgi:serine/threonine protein kinase
MATSAQNSPSDSEKLPKEDGLGAGTHSSNAGDALTDSDARKSKSQIATTILFESGHRIRDYELLELLGQGGMGSVWKAKHTRLKRMVALKLLPPERMADAAAVARFTREMEAVGQLRHPHIIEALDASEEAGTHYLVMEYVEGIELAELSKKVGQFPIADACELMRQTALNRRRS